MDNIVKQGELLSALLHERLLSTNSIAAPYVFDIRGRGGFWAVEFDFKDQTPKFKEGTFAIATQQKAFENGLIIMGLSGGANLQGTKGDHLILAPSYNVTKEDIEKIVGIFVQSIEETLKSAGL